MNELVVIVVNRNCLQYTKSLMKDLSLQSNRNFDLVLIDNASTETGTSEFINLLLNNTPHTIIKNPNNESLNKIWNTYANQKQYKYVSFLNNDIEIPTNFIDDTLSIFKREGNVSCVIHATNHTEHQTVKTNLDYRVLPLSLHVRQGWDLTIKTETWEPIPETLQFYCGDDFIYEMMRRKGLNVAVALSSPVIHYQGMTRKNSPPNVDNKIRNQALADITEYKRLGYTHIWTQLSPYSTMHPTYKTFKYENGK
jgi:GT2 family glycosyltransferase